VAKKRHRKVTLQLLRGEPLDGTGRVCIHLVVPDEEHGTYIEPHFLHPELDAQGQPIKQRLVAKPTRVRLACSYTMTGEPINHVGMNFVVVRTDDPRAATCPKCIATKEYAAHMQRLGGI